MIDMVNWPPYRTSKADVSRVSPSTELTLETPPLEILCGGQFSSGDLTRRSWAQFPPGQSFSLSLCGPISLSRANAHVVHMG